MASKFRCGHDGEFFVRDISTQRIVASQGIVPGTKDKPEQLLSCVVHRDNLSGEFGTPPAESEQHSVDLIRTALEEISKALAGMGYEISWESEYEFTPEEVYSQEGLYIGCLPDYNAWEGTQNPQIYAPSLGLWRFNGGHVHLGWDYKSAIERWLVVRAMELCAGTLNIIHRPNATRRREFYGKSGAARLPKHGVEVRSLDNFWYQSDDLIKEIFRCGKAAVTHAQDLADEMTEDDELLLQQCINQGDSELAHYLRDKYSVEERIADANRS